MEMTTMLQFWHASAQLVRRLVQERASVRADCDTGLIERHRTELLAPSAPAGEEGLTLAAVSELDGGLRGETRRTGDFFFQAEDGIRDYKVTGVQTCALPI